MRCPLQRSGGGRARAGRQGGRPGRCCPGGAAGERLRRFSTGAGGRGLQRRRLPGCPTRLRGAGGGAAPGPGTRGWSRRRRGRWDGTGCTGLGRADSAGPPALGPAVSAPRPCPPLGARSPSAPGAPWRAELRRGQGPRFWQRQTARAPVPPPSPPFDTQGAKYFTLKAVCALWSTESLKKVYRFPRVRGKIKSKLTEFVLCSTQDLRLLKRELKFGQSAKVADENLGHLSIFVSLRKKKSYEKCFVRMMNIFMKVTAKISRNPVLKAKML